MLILRTNKSMKGELSARTNKNKLWGRGGSEISNFEIMHFRIAPKWKFPELPKITEFRDFSFIGLFSCCTSRFVHT